MMTNTRKNLIKVLKNKRYVLEEAKNGLDGLTRLKILADLIMLDLLMPEMDGFAFLAFSLPDNKIQFCSNSKKPYKKRSR